MRLPYAENDFAYYLLGKANDWSIPALPMDEPISTMQADIETHVETNETRLQAQRETPIETISISRDEETSRSKIDTSSVSEETRATILRLHRKGKKKGEIASAVGLASEKYKIFSAVCKEMGLE